MRKLFACILLVITILPVTELNAQNKDWANLKRYEKENLELLQEENSGKRVVFMGNYIKEGWVKKNTYFLNKNGFIGRGVGGQ